MASGPWLPKAGGTVDYVGIAGYMSDGVSLGGLTVERSLSPQQLMIAAPGEEASISPSAATLMVADPTRDYHAATKKYVDDTVAASGGGGGGVNFGVCDTSSETAAKVVTLDGFELATGALIFVRFSNTNSASIPTLNVNGSGAKQIKKYGSTAPEIYAWDYGEVVAFVYDGTYWVMVNGGTATTTYYGVTKLSDSVSSSSTTLAATSNAVRQVYSAVTSRLPLSGGDMAGNIDMNNHFVTGLPAAYAPSDAVSLSTVIKLMVSSYSTATAIVRGLYGSENRTAYIPVTFSVSGNDGSDMLLYINSTITLSSCNLSTITNVTLQFPPIYKEPGGDWSYVSNALRIKYGSSFVSLSRINTGIPYSVVFEAFAVASDITISGYARVGVVQL